MKNLIILNSEKRKFPYSENSLAGLCEYLEEKYLQINYRSLLIPKLRKYALKEDTLIVCLDKEMEELLKKHNVAFVPFSRYVDGMEYQGYMEEATKFMRNLPNILPEIDINHNGLSFWAVNDLALYELFFMPLVCNIKVIDRIIKIEKPENLVMFNSVSMNGILQREFSSKVKIVDKAGMLSKLDKLVGQFLVTFMLRIMRSRLIWRIQKAQYRPKQGERTPSFKKSKIGTPLIIFS